MMARHNVTQMQLRGVLGVSQTGVSKRLRGLTPFDANDIDALAAFFSELAGRPVTPGELFGAGGGEGPGGGRSMTTAGYTDNIAA